MILNELSRKIFISLLYSRLQTYQVSLSSSNCSLYLTSRTRQVNTPCRNSDRSLWQLLNATARLRTRYTHRASKSEKRNDVGRTWDVSGRQEGCPRYDDRAMSRTSRRFRSPPGRCSPEPFFGRFWKRILGKVQEPRWTNNSPLYTNGMRVTPRRQRALIIEACMKFIIQRLSN